jgi:undecaprenyl-diphosphatase
MMPDWLAVTLLGIIEGITEFLPVSSTGHLLIAQKWLPRQSDLFNIFIQSGAVLAVLPLFPHRLHQFIFRWRERETQDYLLKIFVAFAITGVGGLILSKLDFKLEEDVGPIAAALFVGGLAFVVIEMWLKGKPLSNEVTWSIVVAVGVAQLVAAIFPGTSRSGSTIIAALVLGLNRAVATEFTFLVGIPTMLAAGGLEMFKELRGGEQHEDMGMLLLGFLVSAAVSFVAVKWLLGYVRTHTFTVFGWYRIGVAVVVVLLLGG